ncbi:MAG: hypothetical protein KJO55_06055, partial [Gammaproteobacteria bacterium]|nr:hypothetical protein [Gammaproteobacteria bacterium]
MTRQVAQALRELAKAYGYGQLGWPEYRAERRRLLDILFDPEQGDVTRPRGSDIPRVGSSISGGSIAPAAIPGTSREKKPTVAPEKPAELPRELAGASSDSASKRKGLPIVPLIAIAGAIVIAAVGVVVLTSQDKQATTTAAIATPDAAARDLIENFLTDNDWRDRRLDDLAEQWLALTPAERSAARSTPWKRDLENEIEDIIEELGAVGPLDNDEPVIRLARALGMNIPTTAAAPRPTAPDTTIQRPDELPAEAPPGQVVDAPGTSMAANDYDNADNNENLTAIDDLANELESTATSQTVAPSATDNSSIAEAVAEATPADTVTTPATEISDRPAQTPSTVAGIQTQSESVQANTTPAQTTPAATPAPPIPAESQPPTARATDRVCHAGLLGTRRPTCQD